jgi:tubulin polyglutamylase TTLL6/13
VPYREAFSRVEGVNFVTPASFGDFQAYCRQKKNKSFISKPENGCQGKGIFISKNPKDFRTGEHQVVQQYISKPFIIDGFKFDFRIYVLVTQCDPLHIFVYKDGLGRFATRKYVEPTAANLDDVCMHLTNYAINKLSKDFVRDDECGSKRRITTVNKWFEDNGYDVEKIWRDIEDIIIKTLIACHPVVKHNYRSCFASHMGGSACFEILGFDVMLDRKLKPWLIEVNHSPSFHTDAPLDKEVKEGFLYDTLCLLNLNSNDKRKCQEEDRRKVHDRLFQRIKGVKETRKDDKEETQQQYEERTKKYEDKHMGGFRRIYPENGNEAYYEQFYTDGVSLFTETAASKARQMCAKLQREQIESKQRELDQIKSKLSHSTPKPRDQIRPESPRIRWPRVPKSIPRVAMSNALKSTSEPAIENKEHTVDTSQPLEISDQEELQRMGEMMQRDSLVKRMGLVEYVSQALRTSPGCNPTHRLQPEVDPNPNFVFNNSPLAQRRCQPFTNSFSIAYKPVAGTFRSGHGHYRIRSQSPHLRRDPVDSFLPLAPLARPSASSTHMGRVYSGRVHRDSHIHSESVALLELPSASMHAVVGSHQQPQNVSGSISRPVSGQTPTLAIIGSSKVTLTQRVSNMQLNRGGNAKVSS